MMRSDGSLARRPSGEAEPPEPGAGGFVIAVCFLVAFTGLFHGYDNGVTSDVFVMPAFRRMMGWPEHHNADVAHEQFLIVSASNTAAAFSAVLCGHFLVDVHGRKPALIIGSVLVSVGGLLQATTQSAGQLILGRIVAGLGEGITSSAGPSYISEVAPPKIRGAMVGLYQSNICIAILGSAVLGWNVRHLEGGWRISLGAQIVMGGIGAIGMLFVGETPRFLEKVGRREEALATLSKLRGGDVPAARRELELVREELEAESSAGTASWGEIFLNPFYRNVVIIGCLTQFFQIITGINAIVSYGGTLFRTLGLTSLLSALTPSLAFTLGNTIGAFFLVDTAGRRTLLVYGMSAMAFSLLAAGALGLAYGDEIAAAAASAQASVSVSNTTTQPPTWTTSEPMLPPVTAAPAPSHSPAPPSSGQISPDMQSILDQHNIYRCMHGMPILIWDEDIAANAQAHAETGEYGHSPQDSRVINGERCGENLAFAWPRQTGPDAVKAWYSEILYTDPRGLETSFRTETGHYTAIMWWATIRLGCGRAGAMVNGNAGDYTVCQYGPSGNWAGQFEANLLPPIHDVAQCGGCPNDDPTQFPSGDGVAAGATCASVVCGGHLANSCAACSQGSGQSWCNGGCQWSPAALQCVSAPCAVGDVVVADYTDERCTASDSLICRRYSATIAEVVDDGSITVDWADGDLSHRVKAASQVRKHGNTCDQASGVTPLPPAPHGAIITRASAVEQARSAVAEVAGRSLQEQDGGDLEIVGYGIISMVVLYMFAFGISWGFGAWLYISEIMPLRVRGKAVGLCTGVNWGPANFLSAFLTPRMIASDMGPGGTLLFFGLVSLLVVPFAQTMLPETRGLSLEEITPLFRFEGRDGLQRFVRGNLRGGLGAADPSDGEGQEGEAIELAGASLPARD